MTIQEYIQSFHEYRMRIFYFCKNIVHQKEDAEDITSAVFVKLWYIKERIEITSVKAWLMICAKNKCFDHLSMCKHYRERIEVFFKTDFENDEIEVDQFLLEYLYKLIDSLPEQQRKVFKLKYFEEKGNAEIQQLLNLKPSTVRNNYNRALIWLFEQLKKRGITHA